MAKAKFKFWGVRGSMAAPGNRMLRYGGNTNCLEIDAGRTILICDAGTGIRSAGHDLMRRFGRRRVEATILLSHVHWDHYIGLPFFNPFFYARNRFVVAGPRLLGREFGALIEKGVCPPYFPVKLEELAAKLRYKTVGKRKFKVGTIGVEPFAANHPGGACGWKFVLPGGKSAVLMTDNEPTTPAREEKLVEFLIGTDVLIHDAQYTPKLYERRKGWGHSPYTYPIELAKTAGISTLYLTHFDPDDDDRHLDGIARKARAFAREIGCHSRIAMAREGLSFSL